MGHRHRHQKKDVEDAIREAESRGWTVMIGGSHRWGGLRCPWSGRDGCQFSIHSTPRNARNHADQIRRALDRCPHQPPPPQDEGDVDP